MGPRRSGGTLRLDFGRHIGSGRLGMKCECPESRRFDKISATVWTPGRIDGGIACAMLSSETLTQLAQVLRRSVEARLDALVPPPEQPPSDLHRAMRHTLMAPGKRVRALLALFAERCFGGSANRAMSAACALEMVHAASLILDDLPAMDNASLRRGLPANHRLFGEATAILASVALLNRAFGAIAEDEGVSPEAR